MTETKLKLKKVEKGWKKLKKLSTIPIDLERIKLISSQSKTYLSDSANVESLMLDLGLNNEGLEEFPEKLYPYCGQGLRIWQYPIQFSKYLVGLSQLNITSYLELGIRHGGTFVTTVEYLQKFNSFEYALGVDIIPCPSVVEYSQINPKAKFLRLNTQSDEFKKVLEEYQKFDLVTQLLQTWQQENRLHFIIWSGLWIPIVEKYRQLVAPQKITVDACRIDAEISATFKIYEGNYEYDQDIWLWNWEQQQLIYELPVTNQTPIPYADRENRFVTHGGGWGIGTYQNRIAELEEQGFLLDIVAYNLEEATNPKSGNRYFMVDPNWSPWHKNQHEQHDFPPFGEVTNINEQHFTTKEEYHGFYDLAKKSKAIISKPGGGTLIDSLSSATPIILLEAYGYAEEKNAAIWEHLGYGISYEKWKELNYSEEILLQLHQNLLAKNNLINYPQKYAERLAAKSCLSSV